MRRTTALVPYGRNVPAKRRDSPAINLNMVIILALAALVVWFLVTQGGIGKPSTPAGTYSNLEEWEIEWTADGLPKKVTVHRNATRT